MSGCSIPLSARVARHFPRSDGGSYYAVISQSLPCQSGGGGTRSVPEGAPWTQAVNLHIDRSARKPRAPPSARMLATSPVATGEAKIGESPQGDGNLFMRKTSLIVRTEISKPYPRKGTETMSDANGWNIRTSLFQNHIPARGRKPTSSIVEGSR